VRELAPPARWSRIQRTATRAAALGEGARSRQAGEARPTTATSATRGQRARLRAAAIAVVLSQ